MKCGKDYFQGCHLFLMTALQVTTAIKGHDKSYCMRRWHHPHLPKWNGKYATYEYWEQTIHFWNSWNSQHLSVEIVPLELLNHIHYISFAPMVIGKTCSEPVHTRWYNRIEIPLRIIFLRNLNSSDKLKDSCLIC